MQDSGRRKGVLDIREMIRRIRSGQSDSEIARDLEMSRNTVQKYREWAQAQGFLKGAAMPDAGVIEEVYRKTHETTMGFGPVSCVEPYRAFVMEKMNEGVELKALLGLLRERGFQGSYSALRRFARRNPVNPPEVFTRVETDIGEECQVDFGYVGKLFDRVTEMLRKAWVFVVTLSWSRHMYAEIVFDQRVETWVMLHIRAFEAFGGVPKRVRIDNLKAGISKACLYDPEVQRTYRELAEAYSFMVTPCRARTPRHKGKVEKGGVHYVKRNALKGRTFADLVEANRHLLRWVQETAGVRDHGTTHEAPLARFERERPLLKPLPAERYEPSTWKQVKLHPDGHIVFDYAFYSAPYRFVGRTLWVRGTAFSLEIFHDHERVTTHPRAAARGLRFTHPDHVPPEKLQGMLAAPARVRRQAEEIGPKTAEFVEQLLAERPLDRLRGAQGIVGLAKRVGAKRLEAACQRALEFNEIRVRSVRNILDKGLEGQGSASGAQAPGPLPKTSIFARPITDQMPIPRPAGAGPVSASSAGSTTQPSLFLFEERR